MQTESSSIISYSGAPPRYDFGKSDSGAAPPGYVKATITDGPISGEERRPAGYDKPRRSKPSAAKLHSLAEHLQLALTEAKRLEEAVGSDDPQLAAIAGIDLQDQLRELWRLRDLRNDDWATIINNLQMANSRVDFEKFTLEMASAVRMIIESHLRPDVDNDDIRAATTLLERSHHFSTVYLTDDKAEPDVSPE
ncbi:MAG: hypothetical protein ABSG31_18880 [Tepidisphaeraceae bacterium]|jgi:hypothetical protein